MPGVHRALQHRLDGFRRERDDGDRVGALCDHVLDQLDLKLRVGARRADLVGVVSGLLSELVDALFHPVEPLDA